MAETNLKMKGSEKGAKRWLWTIVEIIILIVVAFIIARHLPRIQRHLQQVSWLEAAAAAAALFTGYLLYAVRWQRLLIHKPGFVVAFQAANVGQMINMWIPSRLGIVARSIILNRRESIPTAEVPGSVVVERWLELVLQVTALSGALVLGADLGLPLPLVISMMVLILGLLVALLLGVVKYRHKVVETWPPRLARLPRLTEEKVRQVLSNLLGGLAETVTARRLLVGFLWSIVMWSFFFGYYNITIRAINTGFQPDKLVVIALGALGLAPPSVALKPWTYVALIVAVFSLFGFNTGTITAYALALIVLQAILVTGLGLWGWYSHPVVTLAEIWPRSKKKEQD
jgi:uncharacterized protein (TIRG00374 family)